MPQEKKPINQNLTVPNALSVLRILVVPFFAWRFLKGDLVTAAVLLCLSGLSDLFDGMIARKFNQVTELGKMLDPFADKLTQGVVALCLAVKFPVICPVLAIFILKELTMLCCGGYLLLKKQNKKPLLAAGDIYRPAAIHQLEVVGQQLDIPVFQMGQADPVDIARAAVAHAVQHGNDMVFLDTAGRLHVDEELMDQLKVMKAAVDPHEILLVVDAMIGQDAVNAAKAFDEALDITGVMLTKLDGDARGGAALSIRAATGKPIKFVGTGEKLDMIELFHPDRMASRILGMGDVLSLIEKAQQTFDMKKAAELQEKMKKNRLTLTDFYEQMQQFKNMGSLADLAGMLPGVDAKALEGADLDKNALGKTEAIILSMTPAEREDPSLLNNSRKKRIAAGSGTQVVDINRLLKQFEMMRQMTKQFSNKQLKRMGKMGKLGKFGKLPGMPF